jgi:hypothetical protein
MRPDRSRGVQQAYFLSETTLVMDSVSRWSMPSPIVLLSPAKPFLLLNAASIAEEKRLQMVRKITRVLWAGDTILRGEGDHQYYMAYEY